MKKSECLFIVCLIMVILLGGCCTPRQPLTVSTTVERDTLYTLINDTVFVEADTFQGSQPIILPVVDDSYFDFPDEPWVFDFEGATTTVAIGKTDTVYQMRVKTVVKEKEVPVEVECPVIEEKVVEKIIEVPAAPKDGRFPWELVVTTLGALWLWLKEKNKKTKDGANVT